MRLIDSNKLTYLINDVMRITDHGRVFFGYVLQMVSEQPTAFDKDKVLSSLAEKMNRAYELDKENDSEYFEGEGDAFYRAIQIVEKGGLE